MMGTTRGAQPALLASARCAVGRVTVGTDMNRVTETTLSSLPIWIYRGRLSIVGPLDLQKVSQVLVN